MQLQTSLRRIQAQDLPIIYTIEVEANPFPWTLGILEDCLRAKYEAWLIEAEEIYGFAFMMEVADEAHILNISIHPQFQRQGFGKQLLLHLLDIANQHLMQTVFLEVRQSNQVAIQLYHQLGFNELGIRKNYYEAKNGREDALLMAKTISMNM